MCYALCHCVWSYCVDISVQIVCSVLCGVFGITLSIWPMLLLNLKWSVADDWRKCLHMSDHYSIYCQLDF